jgi:hypothetical protein
MPHDPHRGSLSSLTINGHSLARNHHRTCFNQPGSTIGLAWTKPSQDRGRSHTLPSQKVAESREKSHHRSNIANMIASLWPRTYVVAIWSHDDSQFGRVMSREIIYGRQGPLLVADNHGRGKLQARQLGLTMGFGAFTFDAAP